MCGSKENKSSAGKRIGNAFFCGISAGVFFTTIWFLLSKVTRSTGIALLVTGGILFLLNVILRIFLQKKEEKYKRLANIVTPMFSILLLFSVAVYTIAPSFLFLTNFDEKASIALAANQNTEAISIKTENGVISGWLLRNTDGKAPLVLYFGGNADNASSRILDLLEEEKKQAVFQGYNFAFLDYPGYGKSDGTPTESTMKQYGLDVFDYFSSRSDVGDIIVFGFSIGTGVSNYVASQREIDGLILMAPYADGYDLYNNFFDIFHGPFRLLVNYKMEAVKFAEEIKITPLIFAAETDEMVPYTSSTRLSEAYPEGSEFITVDGILHNGFWETDTVLIRIKQYLKEVSPQ